MPICFLLRDAADAIRSAEFRPELEGADAAAVHDFWKLFDLGAVGATVDWPGRAIELIKQRGGA